MSKQPREFWIVEKQSCYHSSIYKKEDIIDAKNNEFIDALIHVREVDPAYDEAVRGLVGALASSKNFMYNGLLELTAHMGIPEKRRNEMIGEIFSNYLHFVDSRLDAYKAATRGEE